MPRMIFVNLPVRDLVAATRFYEAIGCTRNERFSNDRASAMVWSDTISFMLLKHDFYATFTDKPIGDAHKTSAMLLALSRDSREDVDGIVAAAKAAGGRIDAKPPEELGFMYSRDFEDLDGNGFGPFWMDGAAAPPHPGA